MKLEWKKTEKDLYLPGKSPQYLVVPSCRYLTIAGKGNPNTSAFAEAVEVLFTFSWAIKMKSRSICEYMVYPLEGIWDLSPEGRTQQLAANSPGSNSLGPVDKDELVYEIMIRQPDHLDDSFIREIMELTREKKQIPLMDQVALRVIEDGPSVQILHSGSYDAEPASFEKMEAFCRAEGLRRTSKTHREIYLSDSRKTAPEKLKTILRFKVE